MPNVTINTQYSEREEFVYCFTLMSDVYQNAGYYQDDQLPKLIADIQKDLRSELKKFSYLLPLFCHKSYELSLFTNCRRLFISESEDLVISAEELISRVLNDDPNELTARVFMTADNNSHNISFYRKLITESLAAVKHCLEMDIDEDLRSVLLSLLVERKEYHEKMTSFAFETLHTLRRIFTSRNFGIKKVLSIFNSSKIVEALLDADYITDNDTVIITPILLNPCIIYRYNTNGVKHFKIGIDYEQGSNIAIGSLPMLELETIGKIFGDPTRCEIIRLLKTNGSYLSDLAKRLNIPVNSLHYHIQTLSDAGVIKGSYRGKRFVYDLNPQFFKSASHTLINF